MADYKQLYVFVEGPDDDRFIDSIIKPKYINKYNYIKIIQYASEVPSKISNLIAAIRKQSATDYIFICDMDARGDKNLCITSRKEKINNKFENKLEFEKILVVKEEIESWYLAGINEINLNKMKIKKYDRTEEVTKEDFIKLIPKKKYASVSEFMIEILKEFDLKQSVTVNYSLDYFLRKHVLDID